MIRVAKREVQFARIAADPQGKWIKQVARNLTEELAGFLSERA